MNIVQIEDLRFELFIPEMEIEKAVVTLAGQIDADYAGRNPILLVVLNGAFIFAADLVRKVSVPVRMDFVKISSYQGTISGGEIREHFLWQLPLAGEHIIVVEDIVDTGHTMHYLLNKIKSANPASVEVVCLLKKTEAYQYTDQPRYEGVMIPDKFVVGYGLDYNGMGRDLKSIYCKIDS